PTAGSLLGARSASAIALALRAPRRDFRLILFSSFTANCQGQARMPEVGFFKLERALTPRAYILTAFPKPRDSAQRRSSGGTFVGGNSTSYTHRSALMHNRASPTEASDPAH